MKLCSRKAAQRGVTLVELVITIVVIGVGLAGILIVMDRTTRASGNPVVQHQAIAIAEAYLEEILAKPFCDPDVAPCQTGVLNPPGSPNCLVCPAAEGSRDLYDNVCDYNGLPDTVVRNQIGNAIAGLAAYAVQVNILTNDSLGTGGTQLNGAACEVLRVQIQVTGPGGTDIRLSGYRTNY